MGRYLLVICLPALFIGCGTLNNLNGVRVPVFGAPVSDPEPFGGVANDLRWARRSARDVVSAKDLSGVPIDIAFVGYFGLVDLPLSLVGDTLTLPRTIRAARRRDVGPYCQPFPPIVREFFVCDKCWSLDGGIYGKGPTKHYRTNAGRRCVHEWRSISEEEFRSLAAERFDIGGDSETPAPANALDTTQ